MKDIIIKLVLTGVLLVGMFVLFSAVALYVDSLAEANRPHSPTLGDEVLIFPEGWTPVTQNRYGIFMCERDGVYRRCDPVSVEVTDQP